LPLRARELHERVGLAIAVADRLAQLQRALEVRDRLVELAAPPRDHPEAGLGARLRGGNLVALADLALGELELLRGVVVAAQDRALGAGVQHGRIVRGETRSCVEHAQAQPVPVRVVGVVEPGERFGEDPAQHALAEIAADRLRSRHEGSETVRELARLAHHLRVGRRRRRRRGRASAREREQTAEEKIAENGHARS
jgi:hypothetical protein